MDLFFVVGFWLLLYLKWHIHGYSFFFKNHKSYECFTGFNVNVWGQDFFPLSPFRNRAFCFKSPQKVSITLHAMLKIFEQVDHERHFQAGEKSYWLPLDWLGGLYKIGLDHICAWESELLVIVVCSYRGAHTAACRNPHSTGSFSQEYVRNPKLPGLLKK